MAGARRGRGPSWAGVALRSAIAIGLAPGCGWDADLEPAVDDPALGERDRPLASLSSVCAVTGSAPTLTVTLTLGNGGNVVLVQRDDAGRLVLNNVTDCGGVPVLTADVADFQIDGGSGDDNVIVDFLDGLYMSGRSGTDPVIDVDGGTGNDRLSVRGTKQADVWTIGLAGAADVVTRLRTGADANVDLAVSNVDELGVSGGSGNDTLRAGGDGTVGSGTRYPALIGVVIHGGEGNDTLSGGLGDDVFYGDEDTDTVDYATRATRVEVAIDDVARDGCAEASCGTLLSDTSTAVGAGSLTGTGGVAAATLDQYAGRVLQVSSTGARYRITGNTAADPTVFALAALGGAPTTPVAGAYAVGGEGDDVRTDVENLVGSATAANVLSGTSGSALVANTLTGGAAGDTLSGLDGVDVLHGGGGADTLAGGSEADTLNGGAGDDALSGGAGNDTLNGDADDDTLAGGDGNDTLNGGAGDDTFDEGSASNGADVVNGGAGTDEVSYASRSAAIAISIGNATAGNGDGEAGEGDNVAGDVEDARGTTGAFANTITGSGGANRLYGGAGSDVIYGGLGDDFVSGGGGADTLSGGCAGGCAGDGDDFIEADDGVADTSIDGDAGNDICLIDGGDVTIAGCE